MVASNFRWKLQRIDQLHLVCRFALRRADQASAERAQKSPPRTNISNAWSSMISMSTNRAQRQQQTAFIYARISSSLPSARAALIGITACEQLYRALSKSRTAYAQRTLQRQWLSTHSLLQIRTRTPQVNIPDVWLKERRRSPITQGSRPISPEKGNYLRAKNSQDNFRVTQSSHICVQSSAKLPGGGVPVGSPTSRSSFLGHLRKPFSKHQTENPTRNRKVVDSHENQSPIRAAQRNDLMRLKWE